MRAFHCLKTAFIAPEPAAQLAALRIVVPLMIIVTPELRHAPQLAAVPAALRVAPEGLGWFVAWAPIGPTVASVIQAVCVFSALAAMLGVRARLALPVLAVTSFYLFALSQLSGAVWHDMHLLWMAALLAVSPCDEAWAFDRRGQPEPSDSVRYGLPLTIARMLLACIYFFPGLRKLTTSGLAWALSDNLRNQLWWKWAEHGTLPAWRVDRLPWLLHASALFVLAFELSFPVLVFIKRARPWLALAGVAFHLVAAVFLRIPFVSLWALYVVLVDPSALMRRLRKRSSTSTSTPTSTSTSTSTPGAVVVVGAALVAGAFVQGARGQMLSYPFACYPTFEWIVGTSMQDLLIELEYSDGARAVLPHARDANGYRTQRQWGEIWSLAGVTGPTNPERLRAYLDAVTRGEPGRSLRRRAVRARFYKAYVSVVPEERGLPPQRGALLTEVGLGP